MSRIISDDVIKIIMQAGTPAAQPPPPNPAATSDQPKVVIGTMHVYHITPSRPRKPTK